MDKILNLDNVDQYNQLYGIKTLHPLVSVVNLNEATRGVDFIHLNYGLYAIFLKLEKSCDIKYGAARSTTTKKEPLSVSPQDKRPKRLPRSQTFRQMPMESCSTPTCFAAHH